MSGGSYDYACHRVNDFIEEFENNTRNDPLRIAFLAHLRNVSQAMHDIEWVDSGDYGKAGDHEAIKACLTPTGLDVTVKATLRDIANNLLTLVGEPEEDSSQETSSEAEERVDIEEGRRLYELMQADSGRGDINVDNYQDWAADNTIELIVELEQLRPGIPCTGCNRRFLRADLVDGAGGFIGWCIACDENTDADNKRH